MYCVLLLLSTLYDIFSLHILFFFFFFFKQKTAYEMRISDWSLDVCSSDLVNCSRRTEAETAPARSRLGGMKLNISAGVRRATCNAGCASRAAPACPSDRSPAASSRIPRR